MTALVSDNAGVYDVTLDGDTFSLDGFYESIGPLPRELFNKSSLNPAVGHAITVALTGHGHSTSSTGSLLVLVAFRYEYAPVPCFDR